VPATGPNAFGFTFTGTNGSGSGFFTGPGIFNFQRSDGVVAAGGTTDMSVHFPTAIPVPSNANPFGTQGAGTVAEQGSPTHRTSFTLSFFEAPIGSHGCANAVPVLCSATAETSFGGTAVLHTSTAAAPEPAVLALVAAALAANVVARHRRRRATGQAHSTRPT
jgi:hypothetical protein